MVTETRHHTHFSPYCHTCQSASGFRRLLTAGVKGHMLEMHFRWTQSRLTPCSSTPLKGRLADVRRLRACQAFPKHVFHPDIDDLSGGHFNIEGIRHPVLTLFLFNNTRGLSRGTFPALHKRLVILQRGDAWRQMQWMTPVRFCRNVPLRKRSPAPLSRPPWFGLASYTSSGSASRLSARPRPSDPEGTRRRLT